MQGAMAQRGNAMLGAIQPGMGMAESGAASEAALQEMKAQQAIAGGTPWWKAQGDQTTFYSGNNINDPEGNRAFLAENGGGFARSGRGPGGGAVEKEMPEVKPLTLLDALAPGESAPVKDHMGRVMWGKNDAALPRDADEPKWSPGMTPQGGPNSPEAMARYEQARQLQRQRQAASGFNPNKNNGLAGGVDVTRIRAMARENQRNGMSPEQSLIMAHQHAGNPIAPNSLLAGALMGPELLQEQARAEAMVKAAEFRTKEITAQMEVAIKAGDNRLAADLAARKSAEEATALRHIETLEAIRSGNKLRQAELDQTGRLGERELGIRENESKQKIEDKNRSTPEGKLKEAEDVASAAVDSPVVPLDAAQANIGVQRFNQTGSFPQKLDVEFDYLLQQMDAAYDPILAQVKVPSGGTARLSARGDYRNHRKAFIEAAMKKYPTLSQPMLEKWYDGRRQKPADILSGGSTPRLG